MRGSMAINPQDIAEENIQRSALAEKGSPTEFAEDPKNVQLAGLVKTGTGAVLNTINQIRKSNVQVPPTPQERVLIEDDGTYSETARKKKASKEFLSKKGQKQFKEQGFINKPNENAQVIRSAEEAIANSQEKLQQSALDIQQDAKAAFRADQNQTDLNVNIADEDRADQVLDLIANRDAEIEKLKNGDIKTDFNFEYMNTTDDINATIMSLSEVYKDETTITKRGVLPNNQTIEQASDLLLDEINYTKKLLARKAGQTWNAAQLTAAREILARSGDRLTKLAQKIQDGGAENADGVFEPVTDLDRLAFRRQLAIQAGIQLQLKGAQTEAARALQSFKIKVGGEESAVRMATEARRALAETGGADLVDLMANRVLDVNALPKHKRLAALNEMAHGGWQAKTRQMISEMFLSGLLSNSSTQMKNVLGTASFMVYQLPVEQLAGIYGAVGRQSKLFLNPNVQLSPEQVEIDDALMRLKGFKDAFRDAFRVAAIGFKKNEPAGKGRVDLERYNNVSGTDDTYLGKGLDYVGKVTNVPFRFLMFGDEFFKTMSQRGELYVQANRAYKNAKRNGASDAEAQDAAAMVIIDPMSKADDLIEKSEFDTLQSDLGQFGKITSAIQNLEIGFIPIGRYLMAFATAPTNEILRTSEMIPFFNAIGKNTRRDLMGKNGAKKMEMALARYTVGAYVMYEVGSLALEGRITGAVPADPKVRERLPKGWQPYSRVIKGDNWPTDADGEDLPLYDMYGNPNGTLKYISYNGFGPVSAVVALTADIVQRQHLTDDITLRNNLGTAGVAAIYDYFSSVPMFESMTNFISVFYDRGEGLQLKPEKLLESPAGATTIGLVPNPYSSLQAAGDRIFTGSAITDPRNELTYYTEEDILEQFEDGTYRYANPLTGEPDYNLIGHVKKEALPEAIRIMRLLDAYQAENSLFPFRNEEDKFAQRYDTLGRPLGAGDLNIYTRPGRAIFNNLSGFRISEAEPVKDYEKELMRLSIATGGWPLTNPKNKDGVQLSTGVISDWVDMAKNKHKIYKPGLGEVTYKEMLEYMLTDTSNTYGQQYEAADDIERVNLIKTMIEEPFKNGAWEKMMRDPKYADIDKVLQQKAQAKAEGRIR